MKITVCDSADHLPFASKIRKEEGEKCEKLQDRPHLFLSPHISHKV